jgi:hypothetical protein
MFEPVVPKSIRVPASSRLPEDLRFGGGHGRNDEVAQPMTYLRKGRRLYELVAEDIRVNAGLGGTFIREAAVRDVVTEDVTVVWGEQLVAYEPVSVAG